MELAYQYVWLIPVYPLIAALVVGVAVLTANRWIRSIRKVASGFCVFSIGTAMVHSFAILIDQVQGGGRHSANPSLGGKRGTLSCAWA